MRKIRKSLYLRGAKKGQYDPLGGQNRVIRRIFRHYRRYRLDAGKTHIFEKSIENRGFVDWNFCEIGKFKKVLFSTLQFLGIWQVTYLFNFLTKADFVIIFFATVGPNTSRFVNNIYQFNEIFGACRKTPPKKTSFSLFGTFGAPQLENKNFLDIHTPLKSCAVKNSTTYVKTGQIVLLP